MSFPRTNPTRGDTRITSSFGSSLSLVRMVEGLQEEALVARSVPACQDVKCAIAELAEGVNVGKAPKKKASKGEESITAHRCGNTA